MGQAQLWIIGIIGPAILLIVLIALVIRVRSRPPEAEANGSDEATRALYADEDERRREGTDSL